jgi:predicted RNase H-like HicB family nuclease
MKNRYIYPAVIKLIDEIYDVSFPDIDNCFTFGEDLEDALDSANDVLALCLYDMEQDNRDIPKASGLQDLVLKEGESVSWINVWMVPVRDKMENRAIKKTVTIPKWINDIGVENNLNFSQILQAAIKEKYNINS